MSDTDPTPETPVTIGDRLGWWRGAQAEQHSALINKLDELNTSIDGLATPLAMLSTLSGMATSLSDMATSLSDIAIVLRVLTFNEDSSVGLSPLYDGPAKAGYLLGSIAESLGISGVEPGPSTRMLLSAILTCICGENTPIGNAYPSESACMNEDAATRVVAWYRLTPIGTLFPNIVIADFGDMSHIGLTRHLDNNDVPYYTYGGSQSPPASIDLCVVWNFEGDPTRQYVLDGTTTDPVTGWKPSSQFSAVAASNQITLTSNNPMMSQYYFRAAVQLVDEEGPMPGLSMWLGASGIA